MQTKSEAFSIYCGTTTAIFFFTPSWKALTALGRLKISLMVDIRIAILGSLQVVKH